MNKIEELYNAFLENCEKIGNEAHAEGSHGNGIDTEDEIKDFLQHFEGLVNRNKNLLDQLSKELKKEN